MLRLARGRAGQLRNVSFHGLEGARLDALADASLDRLYRHSVLVHIDNEDVYRYLREVRRVLAPLAGRKESWRPQLATAPELREMIRRAGLSEILLVDDSHLLQAFVTVDAAPGMLERERSRLLPLVPGQIGID
jgi:hypothetical protein